MRFRTAPRTRGRAGSCSAPRRPDPATCPTRNTRQAVGRRRGARPARRRSRTAPAHAGRSARPSAASCTPMSVRRPPPRTGLRPDSGSRPRATSSRWQQHLVSLHLRAVGGDGLRVRGRRLRVGCARRARSRSAGAAGRGAGASGPRSAPPQSIASFSRSAASDARAWSNACDRSQGRPVHFQGRICPPTPFAAPVGRSRAPCPRKRRSSRHRRSRASRSPASAATDPRVSPSSAR